jgi:hypothetical protein
MSFIEASSITSIVFRNETYHLNVHTKYTDDKGKQPTNIQLEIIIVKIFSDLKFQVDTLNLVYHLRNRSYSIVDKLNELSHLLYKSILEKLDNTFGDTWGCEMQ